MRVAARSALIIANPTALIFENLILFLAKAGINAAPIKGTIHTSHAFIAIPSNPIDSTIFFFHLFSLIFILLNSPE
jgi:hypothetical protein